MRLARKETMWKVQFHGDYFSLSMHLSAETEDQAIDNAKALLLDHHGFDMWVEANEADAEMITK